MTAPLSEAIASSLTGNHGNAGVVDGLAQGGVLLTHRFGGEHLDHATLDVHRLGERLGALGEEVPEALPEPAAG